MSDMTVSSPYFPPLGVDVDSDKYIGLRQDSYRPSMAARRPNGFRLGKSWATSHTSTMGTSELGGIFKKKMARRPPNSPDLCVLNYPAWNPIEKQVRAIEAKTIRDSGACFAKSWSEIGKAIGRRNGSWPRRLEKRIEKIEIDLGICFRSARIPPFFSERGFRPCSAIFHHVGVSHRGNYSGFANPVGIQRSLTIGRAINKEP